MGKKRVGLPEERVIVLWVPLFLFGAKLPAWNNVVEQFRQCNVGTGRTRLVEQERHPETDPCGHMDIYDPGGAPSQRQEEELRKEWCWDNGIF